MATESGKKESNTQIVPKQELSLVNTLQEQALYLDNYDRSMKMAIELAAIYVKSAISNGAKEQDLIYKMMKARDLDLSFTEGLESIDIIQGVGCLRGQMMYAMILSRAKNGKIYIDEISNTKCTLRAKRDITDPEEKFLVVSMTIEEAKTKSYVWTVAGKTKASKENISYSALPDSCLKDNWKDSPDSMLLWRCLSRVSRWRFADIIKNMYIKEVIQDQIGSKDYDPELELGNTIEVTEEKKVKLPLKYTDPKEPSYFKKKKDIKVDDSVEPVKEDKKELELSKEIVPADIIDLMDKVCEKKRVRSEEIKIAIDLSFAVLRQQSPNADKNEFIRDYLKKKLEDSTEKTEKTEVKTETKTEKTETERPKEIPKKKTTTSNNGLLPFQ